MAAEWILGESTEPLRFASTVGPGTILLQKEKAFGKNFGKQLFCFFSSFVCKIAPIKVKYLFQNSWYLSYVVSKVMSFKIKTSQNFSNQLYVFFCSSISGTSPKFWRIILINLPCPLSMYVFCFRVPFETEHICEVFYDI